MKRKYVLSVLIISLSFQLFSQNEISVELFDCLLEFDDRDTIDYIMLITNENLDIDTIDVKKCVSFTFYDSDSARYFTMIMHSMPINIFDNINSYGAINMKTSYYYLEGIDIFVFNYTHSNYNPLFVQTQKNIEMANDKIEYFKNQNLYNYLVDYDLQIFDYRYYVENNKIILKKIDTVNEYRIIKSFQIENE